MKKILLLLVALVSFHSVFAQRGLDEQQKKFLISLGAITSLYVDTVNEEKMVENAIEGMLKKLDPHSVYISADEVKRMNEPLVGSFDGIGVQFQILDDTINVVQTISGTPAEKVGVLPGDKFIFIDGKSVAGNGIKNSDVFDALRGKRGTVVNVKMKRDGINELLDFDIARDKIPLYSVDASYMVADGIGFIKVNSFGQNTLEEFITAFNELQMLGMKDLIVSLQGNGGGYLATAIALANEFLGTGKLIVYTQGVHQDRENAFATSKGDFEKGRLIILVDEYSASASEILSGAIQDWDRGLILGRRTFGKGLVQRELPLNDGSAMRLTVARYYTPSGRCIQRPYKDGTEKYYEEVLDRYKDGELMHADSIHFPDSLKYKTKVLGRTVYGGGGIMPDVFVPLDTTESTPLHRKILGKGLLNKVVLQYLNTNRKKMEKEYPTFEDFNKNFEVSDELLRELKKETETVKIDWNEKEFEHSKRLIKIQMKAIIAGDLWKTNEYYQVINEENESLKKAIEILQASGEYDKYFKVKK